MKVALTTPGRFHTFALARELHALGRLERVFTGFPWWSVARERLPRNLITTFPYVQLVRFGLSRIGLRNEWVDQNFNYHSLQTIDQVANRWLQQGTSRPDIYIALSGAGLESGYTAKAKGIPYICDRGSAHIEYQCDILREEYYLHGARPPIFDKRVIERELAEYELADAITVPSRFAFNSFLARGIAADKLKLVPYGVDLSKFFPVGKPQEDLFQVVFIGAVSLQKGVPYLLKAFSQLEHPNKRLILIGSQTEDLKVIERYLPARGVTLHGHMPNKEIKEVLSRSNVLVLPSIQDGFGMVLSEALACGCPVIASTNTGGLDLFDDAVEGFVVPIRNADAIAERLQWLADHPDEQLKMSRAAKNRVRKLGGWQEYGTQVLALCNELQTRPR